MSGSQPQVGSLTNAVRLDLLRKEVLIVLRGFMDESHDGSGTVPKLFSLSCVVGDDTLWPWFEIDWVKVLEWKNEQLRSQGRSEISRYHAADCSSCLGEFKGWTVDEQIEFSQKLFEVFKKHPVHIYGFDMPLQLLVQEFPETKPNPVGFAYVILLRMIMDEIGKETLRLYPKDLISLHHDRCDYDAALAEAFGYIVGDPAFVYRGRFASITSEDWQHYAQLQPADLIAYENFKDGERLLSNRKRRKSLEIILDLDSVSGRAKGFNLESIRELKSIIERLDKETKKLLFATARIHL